MTEASATGLNCNTSYTFAAYGDNSCVTALATASSITTLTPSLAESNVTATTATITLSGWDTSKDGSWYYDGGSVTCSGAITTGSADLAGLTPDATNTAAAYSEASCTSQIASINIQTPASGGG